MHRSLPGRPFSPNALLNKAVSNVIASLTFGSRFEYNDLRILKLLDILEDGLKEEVGFVRQVREGSCIEEASVLQRASPEEDLRRGPEEERAFRERKLQGKRPGSGEMTDNTDGRGGARVSGLRGGRVPSLEGTGTHEM